MENIEIAYILYSLAVTIVVYIAMLPRSTKKSIFENLNTPIINLIVGPQSMYCNNTEVHKLFDSSGMECPACLAAALMPKVQRTLHD